jgi:hypothetical protein
MKLHWQQQQHSQRHALLLKTSRCIMSAAEAAEAPAVAVLVLLLLVVLLGLAVLPVVAAASSDLVPQAARV